MPVALAWSLFRARDPLLLRFPSVLGDPFSLFQGRQYRLVRSLGPWRRGERLTFTGTHSVPADRTWDTYFNFTSDRGVSESIGPAHQPHTIAQSYRVFADVAEPGESHWINSSAMRGLRHRAVRVRKLTAETVDARTEGLNEVLIEVVHGALNRGATDNAYLRALLRVGQTGLTVAEQVIPVTDSDKRPDAARLLARLGSHRHFDAYLAQLTDADPHRIRSALARLHDIGDPSAIPAIEPLLAHPHLNVQFDARRAIARLTSDPKPSPVA